MGSARIAGVTSLALEIGAFTLMGFFLYMFLPLIFVFLTETLPRDMAISAIAFVGAIGNLFGGFIGPPLVGWVKTESGSFTTAFVMLSMVGVVAGCLTLLVRVPSGASAQEPSLYTEARADNPS